MRSSIFVAVALLASPALGQAPAACDSELEGLVATVAESLAPYESPHAASIDGFRPISHDFPGMGEHWINLRRAVRDEFDPEQPPILLYARQGDVPVLVGAAFVWFRDPGEAAPGPAALRHAWHEHSGALEDELFAGDHEAAHDSADFGVMVLHVWTVPPLDGGRFDVQNWRLPYLRAGLEPTSGRVDAARALSLLSAGDYYRAALLRMGVPARDGMAIEALLSSAREEVARAVANAAGRANEDALARIWTHLVRAVVARWPVTENELARFLADPRVVHVCAGG